MVAGGNACEANNTVDLIWVDEKMLTQRLIRMQAVLREQAGGAFRSVARR